MAPSTTPRGRTWRSALRPLAGRRRPILAAGRTRSKVDPSSGSKPRETPPAAPPSRLPERERAIALALMRYVPDLIRWARRCGVPADDAPDVAQIAAVRAWRSWETSDTPPEHRASWLFVIVARVASVHHRRAAKRPLYVRDPGEMEHAPDEAPLPDEGRDERAGLASLEQLRAGTTPERWRLFFGHEVEGVAVAALAKRDGIPLGTAYNRLRLARRDLAATITREAAAERTRLTLACDRTTRTKGRR